MLGLSPWRPHTGALGAGANAMRSMWPRPFSGQERKVLPWSQVDHSETRVPSLSPLSKLYGVQDKGSFTAKLRILPQATKFISKKKFLSAQC